MIDDHSWILFLMLCGLIFEWRIRRLEALLTEKEDAPVTFPPAQTPEDTSRD